MNRQLDGQIAEQIYGWVLVPVGKDAIGEGACEILAPHKDMPQEWYSTLPLKGTIGKAFMCPQYSSDVKRAIQVCLKVGLNPQIQLSDVLTLNPETLCKQALEKFNQHGSPKE